MAKTWEAATTAQYDDDSNLAARQALFEYLTDATPLPAPLSDMTVLKGQHVLDIGCGNGLFLAQAVEAGATVVGADMSHGMLTTARTAAPSPVVQADAQHLPFADNRFDTVLALWMLYHVPDKHQALREFRRVLGPGGLLVVSTNSGRRSSLDELVCSTLGELLARTVDHWHARLTFVAEDGEATIGASFDDVQVHEFGTTYEVTDPEVIVRYVGSMIGPIQEEHGTLDVEQLLWAVGDRCEKEIKANGSVTIARRGAMFLARDHR